MTVTKTTLFCRPCHLSTHRGMCCMRGWTLIMMSGLYFFSPASTFLHPQTRSHSEKKEYKHQYIWRAIRSWYYKNEIIIYKERGTILKAHMLSQNCTRNSRTAVNYKFTVTPKNEKVTTAIWCQSGQFGGFMHMAPIEFVEILHDTDLHPAKCQLIPPSC